MQNIIGYKNDRYLKHLLMPLDILRHFLNSFFIFAKTKLIIIFLSLIVFFGFFSHATSADAESVAKDVESIATDVGSFETEVEDSTNEVLDTIIDTLSNLTCETKGIGNLLRSEFTHTCIPAPFFTVALATVISGGLYPGVMMRTYINDDELFPGACDRGDRIDYDKQKLSFSFCNNGMLAVESAGAIAKTAVVIAGALLEGDMDNLWEDVGGAWKIKKKTTMKCIRMRKKGRKVQWLILAILPSCFGKSSKKKIRCALQLVF